MTFVPAIEAYSASVDLDMNAGSCRIWIEDHYRIAGDGEGDYHACDGTSGDSKDIDFPDQEYYVVAKVDFTARKQKAR
ncbi:9057_t:CDS:2, partial [Rhizophagus irregularis]